MSLPAPDLDRLGRAEYAVPRPRGPIDLWLHGNEGPQPLLGTGPFDLDPEVLRRYPDARPLEADLARRHGVAPERVLVTAGADEAIDRYCRAFLGPGRNAVVLTPAFEMVDRYVRLAGGGIKEVPWETEEFPTGQVLAAVDDATCAIVLASPSNPTGLVAPLDALVELSRRAPEVWLFVDLVYADFLAEDPTAACLDLPNVLVVRSFSKSGGLAGLRVGYAVGDAAAIAALRRAGGPFAVSGPSLALARGALQAPPERFQDYRRRIATEREELRSVLLECGVDALPSRANFVLARTGGPGRDPAAAAQRARWLWEGLAALGIAVRWFAGRRGLEDAVRITCPGDPAAFARLLAAVRATLAPQALLFDMDGVLVDVRESYDRAILETAASFGVTVGREELAAVKAGGDANNDWVVTRRLLADRGVAVDLDEVTRRFEDAYQTRLWRRERPTVDVEWLTRLAARLPLGIVTGRPRRDAERFLSTHGLRSCFAAVVCMEDAANKPSPEPVERALALLGCSRGWLLGDTVDDVRAARHAGVVPLGICLPAAAAGVDPPGSADTRSADTRSADTRPADTRSADTRSADTLFAAGAARVVADPKELESLLPETPKTR